MPIAKQNHKAFDSFRIRFYTIPNQSCRYSHHDVKRTPYWCKIQLGGLNWFYQAWVPSKIAERVTIPENNDDETGYNNSKDFWLFYSF
jgi:hypothetical protein